MKLIHFTLVAATIFTPAVVLAQTAAPTTSTTPAPVTGKTIQARKTTSRTASPRVSRAGS